MKANQKGFGIVEILLVAVTIALIVAVGFSILNANKDTESEPTESTSQTETKPVEYKDFESLGIKIKLDETAKQFTYEERDGFVFARNNELKALTDEVCTSDSGGDGTVMAFGKTDGAFNQDEAGVGLVKQFPSFAITTSSPNGFICGTSEEATEQVGDKITELNEKLLEIFKNAEQL